MVIGTVALPCREMWSDVPGDGVDVDGPERRGGVRRHRGAVRHGPCGLFGVEEDAAQAALVVPEPRAVDEARRRLHHPGEEVELRILLLFAAWHQVHLENNCVHSGLLRVCPVWTFHAGQPPRTSTELLSRYSTAVCSRGWRSDCGWRARACPGCAGRGSPPSARTGRAVGLWPGS